MPQRQATQQQGQEFSNVAHGRTRRSKASEAQGGAAEEGEHEQLQHGETGEEQHPMTPSQRGKKGISHGMSPHDRGVRGAQARWGKAHGEQQKGETEPEPHHGG